MQKWFWTRFNNTNTAGAECMWWRLSRCATRTPPDRTNFTWVAHSQDSALRKLALIEICRSLTPVKAPTLSSIRAGPGSEGDRPHLQGVEMHTE